MDVTHDRYTADRLRYASARRRVPDEVRGAAVRALVTAALTLICGTVTVLALAADSGILMPALLLTALGVLASTWGFLDIWICRQIAAQRDWGSGTSTAWAGAAAAGRPPRRTRRAVLRSALRQESASGDVRPPARFGGRGHHGRHPSAA